MPTNQPQVFSLNVPAGVARGTTLQIPGGKTLHGAGFQVRGTFSQTFKLQVSMDDTIWITALDFQGGTLADITAAIADVLSGHWPFISVNVTVNVSGLAIVELAPQSTTTIRDNASVAWLLP